MEPARHVRRHEPERLFTTPLRVLLLEALHLPRLPSQQRSLDRGPIEMVAGELQLEHHLVVRSSFAPRRCQMLQ